MYKLFVKPVLFLFPPEKAHHLTLSILKIALAVPGLGHLIRALYTVRDPRLEKTVFGIRFPNPVGLAAGFDKDGKYFRAMSALGFGFIEIGTVTPRPQAGNPQPRLFRLPKDEALINRMGFNNEGVEAMVARLKAGKPKNLIIGGNIGKNKTTPNEKAVEDYAFAFEKLFPLVDYFVVNVSSPNTPNLRDLQDKAPLTKLLTHLQSLNQQKPAPKPVLLKIAPDLSDAQLDDILEIAEKTRLAGIIATNTTIGREGLKTPPEKIAEIGAGGLSGAPLRRRATEVIRYLKEASGGKLTIIGVGGISSPDDAVAKMRAGADLVQIYSGLIYEGPALVRRINKRLLAETE
ncbi:MAG: quinone-dependent dihydroorotate dehydrogenase [Bacteroidetes bacterium]|nr:MAG: quinone-dependent dihydroorotate dehydrogenase [Bacteroidota bacterium]